MSKPMNDNLAFLAPKAADQRVGKLVSGVWAPFDNVTEALATINPAFRHRGLMPMILKSSVQTPYWFRDGVADGDLIEFIIGSGLSPVKGLGSVELTVTFDGTIGKGLPGNIVFDQSVPIPTDAFVAIAWADIFTGLTTDGTGDPTTNFIGLGIAVNAPTAVLNSFNGNIAQLNINGITAITTPDLIKATAPRVIAGTINGCTILSGTMRVILVITDQLLDGAGNPLTLTTIGTSGLATLASNVLNVPDYMSGGGGGTLQGSYDASIAATDNPMVAISGTTPLSIGGVGGFVNGALKVAITGTNGAIISKAGYFSNDQTDEGEFVGSTIGVYGIANNGSFNYGVMGESTAGSGVHGKSTSGYGVDGVSTTGVGVYGLGATGVSGNSSAGAGVSGVSNTGYGGAFQSNSGVALWLNGGAPNVILLGSTILNNTTAAFAISKSGQGGTPANGFGVSIDFSIADDTPPSALLANQLISKWTTVTHATRTSQFSITGVNSAVTNVLLQIAGSGQFILPMSLANYANDAAAAAGSPVVPVNGLYRNGSNVCMRVT